jgi:hypothetical protein
MEWLGVVVLLVIVAFVAGVVISQQVLAKRRREAVQGLAESLGLAFQAETSVEQMDLFKSIAYFTRGSSHQVLNHLSGSTDVATVHMMDFQFTVGSGKNATVKRQTVAAFQADELRLPGFDLAPESLATRFMELFGVQDIDFEEDEAFSQKFVLTSSAEPAVRRLLDRELRQFLGQRPDIYLSVRPGFICLYRPNQLVPPEKWKDFMGEAFQIYQALLQRLDRPGMTLE